MTENTPRPDVLYQKDSKPASVNKAKRRRERLRILLSVPKTIYFNLRCFDFKTALKMPVLVAHDTTLTELKRGVIEFDGAPSRFQVKIGFGGADSLVHRRSKVVLRRGHVRFGGKVRFGEGVILSNTGEMYIGDGFGCSMNCTFWCTLGIEIGKDTRIGWDATIRDSDGHTICYDGKPAPFAEKIKIGGHCWICADACILKGARLGNNCVLGYRSVYTGKKPLDNTLYAGIPARPVKSDITWEL